MTGRAVIFAGPTLPKESWPNDRAFDRRPPVRQGDFYRAAQERPPAIGLADGYFEVVPTVWHKEILWALANGIAVFGAASIGALRAAELDAFGMRGIGRIYEGFRDNVLIDDDEVAVLHGPSELDYRPLSDAMVDIRATLSEAARVGVIGPDLAEQLSAIAKRLFYKERSYAAVLASGHAAGLPAAALSAFDRWLPQGRIEQKRRDGAAMLAAIRAYLAAGAPRPQISWQLAETAAWRAAIAHGNHTD